MKNHKRLFILVALAGLAMALLLFIPNGALRYFRLGVLPDPVTAPMRTPIRFYGVVQDEHERPVVGANVKFEWVEYRLGSFVPREKSVKSDKDERFSLDGARGKRLDVRLEKEGYYWAQDGFDFTPKTVGGPVYQPDPQRPVVFHLRSKGESEPLIARNIRFALPGDGTVVELDLMTGKIVPAGQGQIRIESWAAIRQKTAAGIYNWRARITVPGGGIVEINKEFEFVAPETGYQPFVEINMPASLGEKKWMRVVQQQYFCKLSNGKFAKLDFRIDGGIYCPFEYFLNPSGSRNLEFDFSKKVNHDY